MENQVASAAKRSKKVYIQVLGAAFVAAIAMTYNACSQTPQVTDTGSSTATGTTLGISPASVSIESGASQTFVGYGGTAPYHFLVASGGGTINYTSGLYSSVGAGTGVVVQVVDSQNQTANATIVTYTGGSGGGGGTTVPSFNLTWSWGGPVDGLYCVQILEAADAQGWDNNYLCADRDLGLTWSSTNPVSGMYCVKFLEPSDPDSWSDNWLCAPQNLGLIFSSSGMVTSKNSCVQILEPQDPNSWDNNYLCFDR